MKEQCYNNIFKQIIYKVDILIQRSLIFITIQNSYKKESVFSHASKLD